jgi:hypothetical protein
MYKHVVLWKLKESAQGMSKQELAVEVKRRLDELPAYISEIKSYETGINIGDYGASFFDVSLILIFDTKDTFWKYTKHPMHDEVVSYISSVMETEEIVDYID